MGLTLWKGRAGEALAAAYLELMGWEVIARNTRLNGVEVDLLARDHEDQVLVEVKLRTRTDYGGAAAAVDAGKRRRLVRAARALAGRGDGHVRIDVVAVDMTEDGAVLRHVRNAVTE